MQSSQTLPPPAQMMQIVIGYWNACCVYTAAKLNIADRIAEQTNSLLDLATVTHTHPASLYRVLRALVSSGIFSLNDKQEYALTPLGNTLRSDVPGSMKAMIIAQLGDHYAAWGNLLYSLKTGGIAFDDIHGMPVWKYYESHPEDGANFVKAMSGLTEAVVMNILPAYDFKQFKTITDIGGGNGTLLCSILEHTPSASGIVFDEAYIAEQAIQNIKQKGLAVRCTYQEGSFFDTIPAGADAYLMKMILHDWDDENSHKILINASNAMSKSSKLLIIESIIPEDDKPHPGKFLDINMLTMTGGKERTEKEWKKLIESAGLKYAGAIPTHSPLISIVLAEK